MCSFIAGMFVGGVVGVYIALIYVAAKWGDDDAS